MPFGACLRSAEEFQDTETDVNNRLFRGIRPGILPGGRLAGKRALFAAFSFILGNSGRLSEYKSSVCGDFLEYTFI